MVYFEKSQPAPTIGNTHNSQEILDRLEVDFHNTAFKRWIIRDNQALNNEFKQYIGDIT